MSWDELERKWRDLHAQDREQSHVSADTYADVEQVIQAAIEASRDAGLDGGAPASVIAKFVVERLEPEALEEIVRDWLEDRGRGS